SWVMITTPPAAPSNLAISPDTGVSSTDGITNANVLTLSGALGAPGLVVDVFDVTTNTDLGNALVTGTTFSKTLNFSLLGAHQLRTRAIDAAGNVSADRFLNLFIDQSTPEISSIASVSPNPRNTPVGTVDVTLTKPINLATFDFHALQLSLNGGPNLITS